VIQLYHKVLQSYLVAEGLFNDSIIDNGQATRHLADTSALSTRIDRFTEQFRFDLTAR